MPIDVRGFQIPETPYRPSELPNELFHRKLEQQRYDYMLQKEKEADDWKKLGLIQDLTDISKHQTASDVANALGNQKANDVFQKYVAAAGNMSPAELAANIQREMGGLVTSMDGIKTELTNGDQQIAKLKQIYPNLDLGSLTRDYRADVVNRHMKNSQDFANPVEIPPSQMDFSNPQLLSHYLPNTKNLDEAIMNPKGLDEQQVLAGGEMSHIQYKGKVPFWRQPNYTPEMIQKGGGYLPKSFVPQMSIKSEDMPTDVLPALKGNQRKMVTKDVYEQMYNQHPLEVEKGTRDMFGSGYDQMNNHEKELAQRDFLYSKISTLDKNNFYQGTATHTPISLIKLNMPNQGKSGSGTSEFNDLYGRIQNKLNDVVSKYGDNSYVRYNALDGDERSLVKQYVGDKNEDNVVVAPAGKGIGVYKAEDDGKVYLTPANLITTLPQIGTNVKANQPLGKAAKEEAVRRGTQEQHQTPKAHDPLGILD